MNSSQRQVLRFYPLNHVQSPQLFLQKVVLLLKIMRVSAIERLTVEVLQLIDLLSEDLYLDFSSIDTGRELSGWTYHDWFQRCLQFVKVAALLLFNLVHQVSKAFITRGQCFSHWTETLREDSHVCLDVSYQPVHLSRWWTGRSLAITTSLRLDQTRSAERWPIEWVMARRKPFLKLLAPSEYSLIRDRCLFMI